MRFVTYSVVMLMVTKDFMVPGKVAVINTVETGFDQQSSEMPVEML